MAIGDAPSWQDLLGPTWEKYLNPSNYARTIANSQFNPVLNGLSLQHSRADMLRGQTNRNIAQAMAPALAQYKAQAGLDTAATNNASAGIANMARQLGAAPGSSGNNVGLNNVAGNYGGLVQAQGATQTRADAQGLTSAQSRVAQMQANRQGELTSKMMDIDRSLTDARRAKADAYTQAFTQGLSMKQQLMSQALANRGAMINQDVLQNMAPQQLQSAKLANQQAKQNMIWQNLQGQQGLEMNDLQMKALKQQMAGSGLNTKSFFANGADQRQQMLDGIMQQFIDPNSGGWKSGFDAHKVTEAMFHKFAIMFPATAKKNKSKLHRAIQDWVFSTNGLDSNSSAYDPNSGGVVDPGIGGSYGPSGTGMGGGFDYSGSGSAGTSGGGGPTRNPNTGAY